MKLAILIKSEMMSGAERRAVKILRELRKRGMEVELWISESLLEPMRKTNPDLAGEAVVYDAGKGAKQASAKGGLIGLARGILIRAPGLKRLVKRVWNRRRTGGVDAMLKARGVDVVHVFLDMGLPPLRACASVYEITSPDIADALKAEGREALSHTLYNAVSESVMERCGDLIPPARLRTAPLPCFLPPKEGGLPGPEKALAMTFAHRLIPRKNGLLFARAAARFLQAHPDWRVDVLGEGPEAAQMAEILAAPLAEGRASLGRKDSIAGDLAAGSVFVSIIEPDNYPSQSLLEAMHFANALIVSDTGYSKAKFIDGNGLVVPPGDEAALLAAMEEMAADPARLDAWRRRSRELVEARYAPDVYFNHLQRLYAEAMSTHP